MRALDLCLEVGVWGRVLRLPPSHDPDSYVRQVGGEGFRRELEGAIPLMDYLVQKVVARTDLSRVEAKIQALKHIVPRIQKLTDRVAMDHYAAVLAERLRISEARIHEMLRGPPPQASGRPVERDPSADSLRAERLLLQTVLKEPSLAGCLHGDVLEEVQDAPLRALGHLLARWAEEGEDLSPQALEARIGDPEVARALAELLVRMEEVEEAPERVCEECLRHLKRRGLDRQIQVVAEGIAQARSKRDHERLRVLEDQRVNLILQKARLKMPA